MIGGYIYTVKYTLAGTGYQMRTRADQKAGAMSSPWDVTLFDKTLYVAMAGIHQIWSVDVTLANPGFTLEPAVKI